MLSKSSGSNKKCKKERRFSQQTLYEQFIADASSPKSKPKETKPAKRSLSNSAPPTYEAPQSSTRSASKRWFRSKPPPPPLSAPISVQRPLLGLNINQCVTPDNAFLPSPKVINLIAERLNDRDLGNFRCTCKYVYLVTYDAAKARKVQKAKVWVQEKPDEVWMNAIVHNEIALLDYLNAHQRATFTVRLVEQAILLSKVETVRWMMTHYPDMFRYEYRHFETAASHGLVKVVRLFHKCIPGSCSEEGVNMAAYNGHVKVVKYIGNKHPELITETTFTLAAMNGQKNVVKHLFFSYNTRFNNNCFIGSMRALALRNGHRKVDSFLRNVKVAEDVAVTTAFVVGTVAVGAVFCTIS